MNGLDGFGRLLTTDDFEHYGRPHSLKLIVLLVRRVRLLYDCVPTQGGCEKISYFSYFEKNNIIATIQFIISHPYSCPPFSFSEATLILVTFRANKLAVRVIERQGGE